MSRFGIDPCFNARKSSEMGCGGGTGQEAAKEEIITVILLS